jgi:hypothetical protein
MVSLGFKRIQPPTFQKVGLSEVVVELLKWWAQQDLNLRPADYESDRPTLIEHSQWVRV